MCIKTAIKATLLCSVPTLAGFGAGVLSVESPGGFLTGIALLLGGAGYACLRTAARAGTDEKAYEVEQVTVAAGASLAIGFLFAFWTGIGFSAGHGLVSAGVFVAATMTLLAAFCLTFVRRLIAREVPWVERLASTLLPKTAASREVASRR